MVFKFFRRKRGDVDKKVDSLNESMIDSFSKIKGDMEHVGRWINHFSGKHDNHEKEIKQIYDRLSQIEGRLEDVWTRVRTGVRTGKVSGRTRTDSRSKQMSVQENVDSLRNLTMVERSVVWVLLNTDLKMGYDDLVVVLGKDKSTLRGQINNIKQKNESLIREIVENDGRKRFYIDEKIKNKVFKSVNKKRISVRNKQKVQK